MTTLIGRRWFLAGLGAAITAPTIVRASSLMPIKVIDPYYRRYLLVYSIGLDAMMMQADVSLKPLPVPKFVTELTEGEARRRLPAWAFNNFKGLRPPEGAQLTVTHHLASSEAWFSETGRWQC